MIERLSQNVTFLPSISEEQAFELLGSVTAAPYNKGKYDLDKTKLVIESCVLKGHQSILEHVNISLRCITNIGTYKDYTRHRNCAFTIESTSFSKYTGNIKVILAENKDLTSEGIEALEKLMAVYRSNDDIKIGRDFLPQCCAATMIMTTNVREWRHIIGTRGDRNDNPLTIELRDKIWTALNWHYPFFFPLHDNMSSNSMCIYDTFGAKLPSVLAL
jgi:thymidylate synthase (FAD)